MLEALSNSNMDWDAPQGGEPIYWVQVGHYHRNDLMRQAMKLEKWPEPDIPKLELSLTVGKTPAGVPCSIAGPGDKFKWQWNLVLDAAYNHDKLLHTGVHEGPRWKPAERPVAR